jgi:hypothetical protein
MPFPVASSRGRVAPAQLQVSSTPWYLSGGIAAVNCIAAYQFKGAVNLAASYINLVNPGTYNCSKVTDDPAFNILTGLTFVENTQLLSAAPVAGTWTTICRYSGASRGVLFGNGNNIYAIFPNFSGSTYYYNANEITKAPGLASAVLAIANTHGYRNGVEDTAALNAATAAGQLVIGANTTGAQYWTDSVIQALATYDTELTPTQIAVLTTAINLL